MVLVRLETQHHPAGDLRPATPTCGGCCCCCCCAGTTIGTLLALPVIIVSTPPPQPHPPPPSEQVVSPAPPTGLVAEPSARTERPAAFMSSRIGAGIGAFAIAAVPGLFLLTMLFGPFGFVDFNSLALAVIATIIILSIWAGFRLRTVGESFVPVVLFVLIQFPIALFIEFALVYEALKGSSFQYAPLAVMMGAVMLGVGILIARRSRRG